MASVEKRKNGYKITVSLGLDIHGKQIKKSKVWKPAPGMRDRQIEEALNREVVLTKETILLKLWGYESDAEDNHVEVYVSFLRKKLAHIRSRVRIKTIRLVGYCLEFTDS
jgi:hypothetical protein